ncbi:MAG: insecticidal toxin protein [Flavobacteriales bacterium]|nr:insecticidal toxin protein [Flavobacteriales bacterium]
MSKLIKGSVKDLLGADTELKAIPVPPRKLRNSDYELFREFFNDYYHPDKASCPKPLVPGVRRSIAWPVEDLDFRPHAAYGVYNWELFYHVPMAVAMHLSKNGQYAEAQRWFHFLFDPTDDSNGPTPERFWKVKPFQLTQVKRLEDIIINLSTGADPELQETTILSIQAWKDAPFRPHTVARFRPEAYMYKTVFAYLDNLIAWGDSLFAQDTGEAIDEAMGYYVLAANLLGPKPQEVPGKVDIRPQTYARLKQDMNAFGNAQVEVETDLLFDGVPLPSDSQKDEQSVILKSIGRSLYFCIPRNEKLLRYWDTVADRLFKIHNSLNLQGVFRQLPLFEPPIDPALLARAAAAGVDVSAIVAGAGAALPLVRYQVLAAKAMEICQEVKSLGGQVLSHLEKEEGEALAILRARHEKRILELTEAVKYGQFKEATLSREATEQSFANALYRYTYYELLLGTDPAAIKIEQLDKLDPSELEQLKLRTKEPNVALRKHNLGQAMLIGQLPGIPLNTWETTEMGLMLAAHITQAIASGASAIAPILAMIPNFDVNVKPWGIGAHVEIGGVTLSAAANYTASMIRMIGDDLSFGATMSAKIGGYVRRAQDWEMQSNMALGEINLLYKQLRGAQVREAIARREWENHQQQIKHAEEIEVFLTDEKKGKKTNQGFYAYMKREVKGLYDQCYQMAFETARKAERALQYELGDRSLSFVQFGHRAGREGLLAGEKLYTDLKRMELAYMDLNDREAELTRHLSLLQLDPVALMEFRLTGKCTFRVPEGLFDMDCPGHYFRRIKSVALSIPCVTGPNTSIHCRVTLLSSSIRKGPGGVASAEEYARTGTEDERFEDQFGRVRSMVTSTAQNDSGMFETNLRDERLLPFEGSGAISEWQLELPKELVQFDRGTLSDAILHMRYTAREGGSQMSFSATGALQLSITEATAAGMVQLFSIRSDFPSAWATFKSAGPGPKDITLTPDVKHYPFWTKDVLVNVDGTAKAAVRSAQIRVKDARGIVTGPSPWNGALPAAPTGVISVRDQDPAALDIWLAVGWGMPA